MKIFSLDDTSNKDSINRLTLKSGSWPTNNGECVVLANSVSGKNSNIGDEIDILECSSDINKILNKRKLKIVGFVDNPYYMYTLELGSTNLGSGGIEQVVYVPDNEFTKDYPITEVFVTVKNANKYISGSTEYKDCVDDVVKRIEAVTPQLASTRSNQIKADAQSQLDDALSDYNKKRMKL